MAHLAVWMATHTRGTRALIGNPAVPSAEERSDGAEGSVGTGITSSQQPWNGCLTADGHPGMPQQAAALQAADYQRNILVFCGISCPSVNPSLTVSTTLCQNLQNLREPLRPDGNRPAPGWHS